MLSPINVGQLELGPNKATGGRKQFEIIDLGLDDRGRHLISPEQDFVNRQRICVAVQAKPACRVRLWIEIGEQDLLTRKCECRREIDRGCCLADPTFLIGECDDACFTR